MSKISVSNLDFFYGKTQALFDISIEIPEREVIAFIGPSGCGKSTFLRTLNRMNLLDRHGSTFLLQENQSIESREEDFDARWKAYYYLY